MTSNAFLLLLLAPAVLAQRKPWHADDFGVYFPRGHDNLGKIGNSCSAHGMVVPATHTERYKCNCEAMSGRTPSYIALKGFILDHEIQHST